MDVIAPPLMTVINLGLYGREYDVKIAFLDIESLRKHRHELSVLLHENTIDAIGLWETRLDNKVTDSTVSIEGYRVFRHHRELIVGDVAIYLKEDFLEHSIKLKSDVLELLVLELAPQHSKPPISGIDPPHLDIKLLFIIELKNGFYVIL